MQFSVTSSGEKSATAQINTIGGYLHGFELNPPETGYATLKVYDSKSSGTSMLLATASCAAGMNSIYVEFPYPRACNSGIYAVLTGTTTYTVGFSL